MFITSYYYALYYLLFQYNNCQQPLAWANEFTKYVSVSYKFYLECHYTIPFCSRDKNNGLVKPYTARQRDFKEIFG